MYEYITYNKFQKILYSNINVDSDVDFKLFCETSEQILLFNTKLYILLTKSHYLDVFTQIKEIKVLQAILTIFLKSLRMLSPQGLQLSKKRRTKRFLVN